MLSDPSVKYRPFPQVDLPDRQWPSRTITKPPRWLSTDLRDGNQALIDPMDSEKKTRFFDLLLKIGVKEIEVGFPSAGATEFDFISGLVQSGRVPDDVIIQVLTQARRDLIERTFESLKGAPRAIVHVYNAVSPAWRQVVFQMDRPQIKQIAVEAAKIIRDEAARQPNTDWHFEYSPETFSTAELDFSLECCEAVMDILQPTAEKPLILNLPATVEAATPNIYADQIEWFGRHVRNRDTVCISLHPHNDRGTGIAAAELGLMAGADRVEGCLFGNGERTGNCDLVTVALNMYTQGINPGLDFSNMEDIVQTATYCNQLPVHPRHPYAGDLVFTAFSGSHQDAIKKGFAAQEARNDQLWNVPLSADRPRRHRLLLRGRDPCQLAVRQGRRRLGSAAGQGLKLPKRMQGDFSRIVQELADRSSRELHASDIWGAFEAHYCLGADQPYKLIDYQESGPAGSRVFVGKIAPRR